jgi:hypothetical protein
LRLCTVLRGINGLGQEDCDWKYYVHISESTNTTHAKRSP